MTDENNEQQQEQQSKTYTAEEVEAMIAGLKSKNDELLSESKSAKQKARELEEDRERIEREQMEKNQEFQSLYEREKKGRMAAETLLAEKDESDRKRSIESAADKLAAELTRDTKRASLLSEKLASMAKHTEEGVLFERGGIAIDKDAVLQYAKEEYPFLVDGSGSTGGGAAGGFSGGAASTKGNFGGSKEERQAAIKNRFNLPT